jgi:hypothetical protein
MKSVMRTILAFLAAVVTPGALILLPSALGMVIAGSDQDPHAWPHFARVLSLIMGTSFLYVLVLGVPAFLLLRWRNAIRWWSAVIVGFVLGCLPLAIDLWPYEPDVQSTTSHWDGEKMVETIIDGVPTLAGWLSYAKAVSIFGVFGAVSGLAFWLVWRGTRSNKPLQATREDARA